MLLPFFLSVQRCANLTTHDEKRECIRRMEREREERDRGKGKGNGERPMDRDDERPMERDDDRPMTRDGRSPMAKGVNDREIVDPRYGRDPPNTNRRPGDRDPRDPRDREGGREENEGYEGMDRERREDMEQEGRMSKRFLMHLIERCLAPPRDRDMPPRDRDMPSKGRGDMDRRYGN